AASAIIRRWLWIFGWRRAATSGRRCIQVDLRAIHRSQHEVLSVKHAKHVEVAPSRVRETGLDVLARAASIALVLQIANRAANNIRAGMRPVVRDVCGIRSALRCECETCSALRRMIRRAQARRWGWLGTRARLLRETRRPRPIHEERDIRV